MPSTPKEPAAEFRQFASVSYQMFLALIEEGFTEQQALVVIGQVIAAALGGEKRP